jgi:hypothetical protein
MNDDGPGSDPDLDPVSDPAPDPDPVRVHAVRAGSDGSGRSRDGRFARFNRHGLGNANARKMYELRQALLEAATAEQVRAVTAKLYELALGEGDVQAAKIFLEFTCGKPVQALEVSGLGGAPLGVTVQQLRAVILEAVGDVPGAQVRVAHALRALARPGEVPADDHAAGPG